MNDPGEAKAVGQAMLQLLQKLEPLKMYGQRDYVDKSVVPSMRAVLTQVYRRGKGEDIPIVTL